MHIHYTAMSDSTVGRRMLHAVILYCIIFYEADKNAFLFVCLNKVKNTAESDTSIGGTLLSQTLYCIGVFRVRLCGG